MPASGGRAPGVIFMGHLPSPARQMFRPLAAGLRKAGYTRFVEPACGSFALTDVAVQAGWKAEQVEASDVTMFSSVLGNVLMGERVDDLHITADGLEGQDLGDPATVLYHQSLMLARAKDKSPYWIPIAKQMELDRDRHIASLNSQFEKARARLGGLSYRPLDLFEHLDAVADDPHTVIALAPPWAKGDFEKFLDPHNAFKWSAPTYSLFDPDSGFQRLYDYFEHAKCLMIVCVESSFWTGDPPAFATFGGLRKNKDDRAGIRSGNMMFISNRNEECISHLGGRPFASPWLGSQLQAPPWPFLPEDHTITKDSRIEVCRIPREIAMYCRNLWTHRFTGSAALFDLGVFLDGYFVGCFGLTTGTRGAPGEYATATQYMYGMAVQHRKDYRFPVLFHYLGMSKQIITLCFPDYTAATADSSTTVTMSPHKTSMNSNPIKGYRAKMTVKGVDLQATVTKIQRDPYGGWATHLKYPLVDASPGEIFQAWFEREERWHRNRQKQQEIREAKAAQAQAVSS